jgi:hypothetical protein
MTAAPSRWTILSVQIRDLLGFQGERRFDFAPGLQVIEAANHTGKTSLALALLWGLTGQIPKLDRLNLKSFRLWNRHAGENASPLVVIDLKDSTGCRMQIRRRYVGRTRDTEGTVEVSVRDEELAGAEADERILTELGVKSSSLEGCGIVLQDLRHRLITGTDAEVGEVVNDMLGLEALSEVVPLLEEMAGGADQLRREIEAYLQGGNPLQRWQEGEQRLAEELRRREAEALEGGFAASALDSPGELIQSELAALAKDLKVEASPHSTAPRTDVDRLRKALGTRRKSSPLARELAKVSAERPQFEDLAKGLRKLAEKWRKHGALLDEESARGEMDRVTLSRQISGCDAKLTSARENEAELQGEQELLGVAYKHLLGHPGTKSCPLCLTKMAGSALRDGLRERIDGKVAAGLAAASAEQEKLKAKRRKAEKRLGELDELTGAHERLAREAESFSERLSGLGFKAAYRVKPEALFLDAKQRDLLVKAIELGADEAERNVAALQGREAELSAAMEEQEEAVHQPIEKRINLVRDALVPLLEAADGVEAHGELRDAAQQRASELERALQEAREFSGRLKKIAAAVSEEESTRATAAIKKRLPFVSDFFARVAGNPDFTGLEIQTNVSRNKVAYALRATSSKMAALGDAVGHVLSEGDVSAAGIALLLGLASGDSHQLGFVLLDDPAQGMDPVLQRNLARELSKLENHSQVIILTHQPDFAAALTDEGAQRTVLGRWEGGKLLDD